MAIFENTSYIQNYEFNFGLISVAFIVAAVYQWDQLILDLSKGSQSGLVFRIKVLSKAMTSLRHCSKKDWKLFTHR